MKKKLLLGFSMFLFASSNAAFAENELTSFEDDVITVYDRARPEYDPRGIRAKSFILSPSLEVEGIYDDNIYAEESDEDDDFIIVVKPVLDIASNWSKHRANLSIYGAFGFYNDSDSEDFEDYGIELDTRFDIVRNTYLKSIISYDREHEERGSPESPSNSVKPIEYDDFLATLGVVHKPGKMSFELNTGFRNLDYSDGKLADDSVLDQDVRDRDEYGGYINVGYEFMPNYEAFIEFGGDIREYDLAASSGKDSEGYYVVGGTEINISGKAKGRVYVGYMERDYDSDAYEGIDGVKFGGDLFWNITEITSLIAEVSRSIEETFLTDYSGYTLTAANLTLEHELKRNVLLAATTGWDNYDYEGAGDEERDDDIIFAGVEAKYLINRNFSAGIGYEFEDRSSNVDGDDYSKNQFIISAKAAF